MIQSHPDSPSGSDATHVTPVRESDYSQKALAALRTLFNGVLRRDTAGSALQTKANVYIEDYKSMLEILHRLRLRRSNSLLPVTLACNFCQFFLSWLMHIVRGSGLHQ